MARKAGRFGPNAGHVTDGSTTFDFADIGNLTGGSANDTFVFQHNLGVDDNISGVLNGGAGCDVADYLPSLATSTSICQRMCSTSSPCTPAQAMTP